VLLLFDAWPLHRFNSPLQRRWALLEKIPLLAISCASAVMTYVIVRNTQGLYSFGTLDIGYRMANAALSYVHYLVSTIAPIGLAVYYPLPDAFNPYQVAAAMAVLCIISGASMLFWNKMPSLIIGWSWFVGTLIPVIGIIQTGSQSMADRFAYIPCLGLFIMIIWPLPNLVSKAPMFARRVGVLAAIALIVLYAIVAACQVSLWKNSETLFMHALRVTKNNYMIHNSLGAYYSQEGDTVQAMRHFAESIRIRPKFQFALYNAGLTMANAGDYAKAKKLLAAALSLDPSYAEAHYSIGACYEAEGNDSLALDAYTRAIALKPDDWMANYRSGCLYRKSGNDSLSEKCFLQALKSNPSSWETYLQLGLLSRKKGENNKAKAQFIQAINADPSRWEPLRALGDVLLSEHKPAAAGKLYEAAIRRAPDRAELHAKYGIALAIQEKLDSALIAFNSALRLSPGDSATMEYRGRVLRRMEEKRSGGVNEHAQRK
jgi:tetratricopeptide (TPR) repeat protein